MRRLLPLLLLAGCATGTPRLATLAECATDPARFGCANHANLRAMVVDVVDLERGREPTAPDGAVEAGAVERLRTDEVKDLRREGPRVVSGGGPGA